MSRKTLSYALGFFASLLLTVSGHAQTWYKVANEGQAITVTTAMTVRYGVPASTPDATNTCTTVGGCWDAPVTMAAGQSIFIDTANFTADPAPYSVKEVDVLETDSSQTVQVVANNTVAALIVPSMIPPPAVPVTPGTSYTVTFSNFSIAPGTSQNALMLAFVNQPTSQASRTWEGTQMNLTIDGVTMVCTYGQTYTDGVFSLSCTVPVTPPGSTPGA